MSEYSSYFLYQKYIKIGTQDWVPVYPIEYAISGDTGQDPVVYKENDPACGYVPVEPIYRWHQLPISEDYECSAGTKYYKEVYQVSYNNGLTWEDVVPEQTRRGDAYETGSSDCIEYRWTDMDISTDYICDDCPEEQYRWTATTGYVCSGTNKMTREIEEVSYDSGATWTPTGDERAAYPLIQADSPDCGYVPPTPQYRTLTTATTCINYDKYVLEEYQVSYDSGVTWTTTGTSATTLIEADSPDCGYIPPSPYETQYFTTIPNNNGKFRLINTSSYYSADSGATWTLLYGNTDTPTFTAGQKIMWKSFSRAQLDYKVFSSTTSFVAEGNVMSLLYGDNFVGQYDLGNNTRIFARLFQDTTVSNVDNLILPATTLSDYCYEYMFSGCYMLRSAPILSATTLAQYCYQNMFQDCNNLQSAPVLPATTLAENCYRGMFIGCTSLTTSPVLSVTTLVKNCYRFMFSGCTNLNTVVCIATDISASGCIGYWLSDVAASGTFFKDANTTWPMNTSSGIPSGWTVQNYS